MTLLDTLTINGRPLAQGPLVATDFYEWQPLELICRPDEQVAELRLTVGETDLGPPSVTLGDPRWRWRWNPEHAVGAYEAVLRGRLRDDTPLAETFTLHVLASKLAATQYEALLVALGQDVRGLVYALAGGRAGATLERGAHRTLVEELFTLVDGLVGEALAVARLIQRRPQSILTTVPANVSLSDLERLDAQALADITRAAADEVDDEIVPELQAVLRPAGQRRGGPLPRTVAARRSVSSLDTPEHRMLRAVLRSLVWRVGYVREVARREQGRRRRNAPLVEQTAADAAVDVWLERCRRAGRELRAALAQPWLAGVGELGSAPVATTLMRREPRYRRLYQLYRRLHATPFLAFDSPLLWLPIQELPALYEQWCALQVVAALLPLGRVVEQRLVEPSPDPAGGEQRWTLRLVHGKPLLRLVLPDGAGITLWYQRRYGPSAAHGALGAVDPFVRVPDVAIELQRADEPPRVLIFDAKYRVAPGGGVPQAALDDAYAYRSAIGVDGRRATLGAFLLFPGSAPLRTVDEVGALPLLPGAPGELEPLLRELLLR